MADRLLRRFPPLTNDWVLGLASASPFAPGDVASLARAMTQHPTRGIDHILSAAVAVVESVNSAYFRFDVDQAIEPDEPRLAELGPGRHSRDAGLGLRPDRPDRKLLALIVLDAPRPQAAEAPGRAPRLALEGTDKQVLITSGLVVVVPAFAVVTAPDATVSVAAFHATGRSFR